jgi:5-methyltetrahydrofolate--homocysteine methyltransferase
MDMKELQGYVIAGKREDVVDFVNKYLESDSDPNKLLDEGMIPAMREIGDKFSRNEAYVPELLIAARAMQAGLQILEPILVETGREPKGKVVLGTV